MNAAEKCFLNQIGEDKEDYGENNCCNVCINQHSVTLIDRKEELRTAIDAIDTISLKGELKIVQWI